MRRGAWHQCGHVGQKIVAELLAINVGVGAVISPKDLALDNASRYSEKYRELGADVLLDPQFYEPEYSAGKLNTYPTAQFRQSIGALGALQPGAMGGLSKALEDENRVLGTAAVIAPAIPYEAARPDIIDLNARLFSAAKAAGDEIGVPTYATVVLGQSSTSEGVANTILSSATALNSDGLSTPERFCSGFPEQKCSIDASKKASDIGGLFAWSSLFPDVRIRRRRGVFGWRFWPRPV